MAFTDLTIAEKLTQIGQDLASLKEQANTTTGGTDNTLKEAVETLIAGYGSGGGSGLFDELSELGYDAETIAELNAIKDEGIAYSKSIASATSYRGNVKLMFESKLTIPSSKSLTYAMYQNFSLLGITKKDFSEVKQANYLLSYASSLLYLPDLDFSSATTLQGAFYNCTALKKIKSITTSSSLTTVYATFDSCYNITEIPYFDTSACIAGTGFCRNCSSITTIPAFDFSSMVTFNEAFRNCGALVSIPLLNLSSATNCDNMLLGCSSLTDLGGFEGLSVGTRLDICYNLTHDSLMNVINGLATVTTSPTLTLGSTLLAKLTDDEVAIATAKGWSVS